MGEGSRATKLGILTILSLTGSSYVLTLRYSKVISNLKYIPTTVVLLQEIMKMVATVIALYCTCGDFKAMAALLKRDVLDNMETTFKMAVPSCLYALQNNLIFTALANMNVPTQQILFQLKIPFTALLCVSLLGKTLTCQQWLSVFMIFAGTGAIEYRSTSEALTKSENGHEDNFLVGLVAVLVAAFCSGLAGVYYEKMLKADDASIWIKNFQMYLWSIPITSLAMFYQDLDKVAEKGFFYDYKPIVWLIIGIASIGGIMVSLVLLYTDNVTKNFSASTALVIATIGSYFLFSDSLGTYFLCGLVLVCCAIYLYAIPVKVNYWRSKSNTIVMDETV